MKAEQVIAFIIYLGSIWFIRILAFMFTAIVAHTIIKFFGLSLPPYF